MTFVNARDLATSLKDTREKLVREGELTVMLNGRPMAIMVNVQDEDYEAVLRDIQQAKALRLLHNMRTEAQERGFLSDQEIDAEISAARQERKIQPE